MRIFLVLLVVCGAFVVALLLGAGIGSERLARRLGLWRLLLWALGLLVPALVLHQLSVRTQGRIARLPAEFIDLRPYEIQALSWLPIAYAVAFLLGAWPLPFFKALRRARKRGEPDDEEPTAAANPPRG